MPTARRSAPSLKIGSLFISALLLLLSHPRMVNAAPLQPAADSSASANTSVSITQDELLKNFLAGMSYQPQPVALPPDPIPPEPGLIFPVLPGGGATDADAELQVPKTVQQQAKKKPSAPPGLLSFIKPVLNAFISSNFGMRWGRLHEGVDLAVASGTPILAAEKGKIIYSGWANGYGNFVAIDHGGGFSTRYGHASRLLVRKGQPVKKGQTIALVGSTGHSTGPHLHFEVLSAGRPQNPLGFINRSIPIATIHSQSKSAIP